MLLEAFSVFGHIRVLNVVHSKVCWILSLMDGHYYRKLKTHPLPDLFLGLCIRRVCNARGISDGIVCIHGASGQWPGVRDDGDASPTTSPTTTTAATVLAEIVVQQYQGSQQGLEGRRRMRCLDQLQLLDAFSLFFCRCVSCRVVSPLFYI